LSKLQQQEWSDLKQPFNTITTKDRLALVTVAIKGHPYVIVDIGLRMLAPRELERVFNAYATCHAAAAGSAAVAASETAAHQPRLSRANLTAWPLKCTRRRPAKQTRLASVTSVKG
jgi:DNA (cytosine-5)-methyltransferase 1